MIKFEHEISPILNVTKTKKKVEYQINVFLDFEENYSVLKR